MLRFPLACPAAEAVHPVLSLNDEDIRCQVAGHMRPAEGSPCCDPDGYVRCMIWRTQRDLEQAGLGRRALDQRQMKGAVLDTERAA